MLYKVSVEFNGDDISITNDHIEIKIKSKPIKNKANQEIIKKLAKHFKISQSKIIIKSGHKSRDKIIEILN